MNFLKTEDSASRPIRNSLAPDSLSKPCAPTKLDQKSTDSDYKVKVPKSLSPKSQDSSRFLPKLSSKPTGQCSREEVKKLSLMGG